MSENIILKACCAGLRKLRDLKLCGKVDLGEKSQGVLNKMLEGVTSLHLRGSEMHCSDVASPTLHCLTAIVHASRLPGGEGFLIAAPHFSPGPGPVS